MPTFSLYQANMDKLDACKYKPHALTFLGKSKNPGGGVLHYISLICMCRPKGEGS